MSSSYRVNISISRANARKFLAKLATDPATRKAVENDPVGQLKKIGITVPKNMLPAQVKLPPEKEILLLLYAGDSAHPGTASPFGLLIVFVFGAMPVTAGRLPAGDGAR